MSITFSGNELVNIAINIEKSGIAFYDIMTRSTENPAARTVFKHLVDMERQHVQIFQGMLRQAEKFTPPDSYDQDYAGYLKTLVDNAVFTSEKATSELASRVSSDLEALELAIGAEKDSILFYYEMAELIPAQSRATVRKIINEEKSHLRQLTEIKKRLATSKLENK